MAQQDRRVPRDEVLGLTVGEVMITNPETLPAHARVADVRRVFERSSQRTVLLAEDGVFRGAIERAGLPAAAPEDELAARYVDAELPTATPATPMAEAAELLDHLHEPRLVVVDEDGMKLRGLLCFNRSSSRFCVE